MAKSSMSPGHWVGVVIGAVVLFAVVAAIFPTLTTALNDYATAEPTFGPVIETLVPLLLGAAILLGIVYVFMGRKQTGA